MGSGGSLSSRPATGLEPKVDQTPSFEIEIPSPERKVSSREDSPLNGHSPAFERRNEQAVSPWPERINLHDHNLPQEPTDREQETMTLFPRLFGSKAKAAISSTAPEGPSPLQFRATLSVQTELPPEVSSVGGRDIRLSGRCGAAENMTLFPQSLNGFIDTVLRQKPKVQTPQKIRISVQNTSRRGSRGEGSRRESRGESKGKDQSGAKAAPEKGQLSAEPQLHWDVLRKHVKRLGHGASDRGFSGGPGSAVPSAVSSEDEDTAGPGSVYNQIPSRRPSISL